MKLCLGITIEKKLQGLSFIHWSASYAKPTSGRGPSGTTELNQLIGIENGLDEVQTSCMEFIASIQISYSTFGVA